MEAGRILGRRKGRFSGDIEVIDLKISQATSIEHLDQKVALSLNVYVWSLYKWRYCQLMLRQMHVPSCL